MSKRDMLKLAASAGAAMTTARAADNALPPQTPYPRGWFGGRGETAAGGTFGPDPIRQAAINLAREQLDRDHEALNRKRRSLERLKSVSRAWVEAQCEQIDRAQNTLYTAFRNFVGNDEEDF